MNVSEITTMVCFHDLLGFGDMVSVSGGTFDSAVGAIAHKRISLLRQSISHVSAEFPQGTRLFQMNDSAIAVCDIDFEIGSMHIDSGSISASHPSREVALKALKFLGASACLHHKTVQVEHDLKIGPAGRTFVVLGKRWPIPEVSDTVFDVQELQANLAFSEAHIADSMGSKYGFSGRAWDLLFVNDYMWFLMMVSGMSIPDIAPSLSALGKQGESFPKNLIADGTAKIEAEIFHRKRTFFSLLSHHAIDINKHLPPGV